jgi:sterol desaturase/sphingolipid hydroxylase (fatty acid hydroxylase superfamily)
VDETRYQLIRSSAFVLSFAAVLAVQVLTPYRRPRVVATPSWRQNLPLAFLNALLFGLVCGACVCSSARLAESRGWGLLRVAGAPSWLATVATFVALDLTLWIWHRANHHVPWLWRFHRVHHSDADFDVTTALRFHAGELLLALPAKIAVVLAIGATLPGLLMFEVVFGLFNLFVHGSIGLPAAWEVRLGRVLVFPSAHRRHHSIQGDLRAGNFGTVFSLWDRAFGTWHGGRTADPIATGLGDLGPGVRPGFVRCLVLPFERRAAGARPG